MEEATPRSATSMDEGQALRAAEEQAEDQEQAAANQAAANTPSNTPRPLFVGPEEKLRMLDDKVEDLAGRDMDITFWVKDHGSTINSMKWIVMSSVKLIPSKQAAQVFAEPYDELFKKLTVIDRSRDYNYGLSFEHVSLMFNFLFFVKLYKARNRLQLITTDWSYQPVKRSDSLYPASPDAPFEDDIALLKQTWAEYALDWFEGRLEVLSEKWFIFVLGCCQEPGEILEFLDDDVCEYAESKVEEYKMKIKEDVFKWFNLHFERELIRHCLDARFNAQARPAA